MSRNMVHLSIMAASPSDVAAEREYLEEIVRELNSAWGKTLGVFIDLVRWETVGFPGVGSDPQEVLNTQIGDDYDIFIGLLWHRLGTPTPRAQSGTIEEFERAYQRHIDDPGSIKIMFYFKDAPVSPSEIDPSQLTKVANFRKRLGEEGVLYWTFSDRETFGSLLRVHLSRQVQEWKDRDFASPREVNKVASTLSPAESNPADIEAEEEGYLDVLERVTEGTDVLTQILGKMAQTIEGLGDRVKIRSTEMTEVNKDSENKALLLKRLKSISNQTAVDFEQFATVMEAELSLYSSKNRPTLDAMVKFVDLQGDFSEDRKKEALDSVRSLKNAMATTKTQMNDFRAVIVGLPRMTTAFNRGRRSAISVLESFDKELRDGITLLDEIGSSEESI
jgi:hypothetical protein